MELHRCLGFARSTLVLNPTRCGAGLPRGIRPKKRQNPLISKGFSSCGAKGSRTPDLLPARQLLYQLSYGPEWVLHVCEITVANAAGVSLADRW